MSAREITNWYGLIKQSLPASQIRDPGTVAEVQQIVRDLQACPSPLRPIGSNHSITQVCIAADGVSGESGTVLRMMHMHPPGEVRISADRRTVTVPAGLQLHDLALLLHDEGLQLPINPEIGNITMAAAACAGTKDSSFPNKSGQLSAYVVSMTLVTPVGDIRTVDNNHPDLELLRSSYGLFGIIIELTLRIRPLTPIRLSHTELSIADFRRRFESLITDEAEHAALFLYLSPHGNLRHPIVLEKRVEIRGQAVQSSGRDLALDFVSHMVNGLPWISGRLNHLRERLGNTDLELRNLAWKLLVPQIARWSHQLHEVPDIPFQDVLGIPDPGQSIRNTALGHLDRVLFDFLTHQLRNTVIDPIDQIIDFPDEQDGVFDSRFMFSFWAFPEAGFADILEDYFRFCQAHLQHTGFRCKLPSASYRMNQDRASLLSPTFDGPRWTIDPVTTGPLMNGHFSNGPQEGLDDFLIAFNQFAIDHEGVPLFNQTPLLSADQVQKAFGDRLTRFQQERRRWDPANRLLNSWFADMLSEEVH